MPIIAQWRDKRWEINDKKIYALSEMSTSFRLKKDENNDSEGKPAAYVLGLEPQQLSFSTEVSYSVGCNPLTEIRSWAKLVGESGNFVLGKRRIVAERFMLTEVNVSEIVINNHGWIVYALLDLVFEEDTCEAAKDKPNDISGGVGEVDGGGNAPPGIGNQQIESALNVGASALDKAVIAR